MHLNTVCKMLVIILDFNLFLVEHRVLDTPFSTWVFHQGLLSMLKFQESIKNYNTCATINRQITTTVWIFVVEIYCTYTLSPPTAEFCDMSLLTTGDSLLTWLNFYPSMDKESYPLLCVGWNHLSIPKLHRLHRWSLGMDKLFHPTLYQACNYLSELGLKLNHVSKRVPRTWQVRAYYNRRRSPTDHWVRNDSCE